jgi:hypothetical protein
VEASASASMQEAATTNSDSLLVSGTITGSFGDQLVLMLASAFTIALMLS